METLFLIKGRIEMDWASAIKKNANTFLSEAYS